ncbi:zinc-binding metallopeptidase [Sinomicrobium sp.]
MKNNTIYTIGILLFGVFVITISCSGDDGLEESRIDTSTPELSEMDIWIRENLTTPYNIAVTYTFDDNELDINRYLTPPKEEEVKPFLDAFKKVMIGPFEETSGSDFVKMYFPKLLVLVGSYNYNNDGTRRLGVAEGGKKVMLYELNYFTERTADAATSAESRARFARYFHTIEHEFGHILQQTKEYDKEKFGAITPSYRSTWNNLDDQEALDLGYISPYSAKNMDEDFVEILATMLTTSAEEFEEILDSPGNQAARDALRAKLAIIVDYYKESWNIDLYEMQEIITEKRLSYFEE